MLNIRFPYPVFAYDREESEDFWVTFNRFRRILPRLFGILAYGVAYLAVKNAGPDNEKDLLYALIASSLLFFSLVYFRRKMAGIDSQILGHDARTAESFFEAIGEFFPKFAVFSFLAFIISALLVTFAPIMFATEINAIFIVLLWGSLWLPIGSAMTAWADKYRFPILSFLFGWAMLASFWNDNHAIRPWKNTEGAERWRPDLEESLQEWKKQHEAGAPFIIVATAGGGIRAAYWTVTVLGDLNEKFRQHEGEFYPFEKHLYAISGVSGGSVGAAVYRSVLDSNLGNARDCHKSIKLCSQKVLEENFLSPTLATLLFPDMFQRFIPWRIPFSTFDRGATLEKSWEVSYANVLGDGGLAKRITSLNDHDSNRSWPALFLNATLVENGRRIIASNIKITKEFFPVALDQLSYLGTDIRISTAAHNSARFPGVSPAGSWYDSDGAIKGHLVDGGYFENYGAETALRVLQTAQATVFKGDKNCNDSFKPIVILISSDPMLDAALLSMDKQNNIDDNITKALSGLHGIAFAHELRSILKAFLNTRTARGVDAAERLKRWTDDINGTFVHFRMYPEGGNAKEPPLGWALSEKAQETIGNYLPSDENISLYFSDHSCEDNTLRHDYYRSRQAYKKMICALKKPGR